MCECRKNCSFVCHLLRKEDLHVLGMALEIEFIGQWKKWRLEGHERIGLRQKV